MGVTIHPFTSSKSITGPATTSWTPRSGPELIPRSDLISLSHKVGSSSLTFTLPALLAPPRLAGTSTCPAIGGLVWSLLSQLAGLLLSSPRHVDEAEDQTYLDALFVRINLDKPSPFLSSPSLQLQQREWPSSRLLHQESGWWLRFCCLILMKGFMEDYLCELNHPTSVLTTKSNLGTFLFSKVYVWSEHIHVDFHHTVLVVRPQLLLCAHRCQGGWLRGGKQQGRKYSLH